MSCGYCEAAATPRQSGCSRCRNKGFVQFYMPSQHGAWQRPAMEWAGRLIAAGDR